MRKFLIALLTEARHLTQLRGAGMTSWLPRTFERGQSARGSYLRRRACAVDRAVHDHWLLWRK